MNKITILVLLICGIALGGIGGYFYVLNYEQSSTRSQPLSSAEEVGKDMILVSQVPQIDPMNPNVYIRPYDNKVITLSSEQVEHSQNEPKSYLRPYDNKVVGDTVINTKAPTAAPTRKLTKPVLISAMKPVTSDVRGNLGPASTITNERMEDWLTDRWQAARNMGGDPIPGEHWVEIDLQGLFYIDKVLIDWEVAFSNDWTIQVKSSERGAYSVLCQSKDIIRDERPHKMHVLQYISVPKTRQSMSGRYVKLVIHRPATRFGSSIWRLQLWGSAISL